jgi:hypothetical protein
MDRRTHVERSSHHLPYVPDGQRRRGPLDASSASGQSDIHTVIDNEETVEGDAEKLSAERRQGARAEILLTHLNGWKPSGDTIADEGHEVTPACLVTISDEAEPQLVQSGTPSSGEDAFA